MSESNQPRVQPGIPTGGQFTGKDRTAATVTLARQANDTAVLRTEVASKVRTFAGELPPFPAELGEPRVTFDYGDNGSLYTTVGFGDQSVLFWTDYYEKCNSIVEGDEPTGLDDDTEEKIIEYGNAAHARADQVASGARDAVIAAQKLALEAAVLGKPAREVEAIVSGVPDFDDADGGAARAAAQGAQAASLWGEFDDDGTHVADTIANLLVYARKSGWDFDQLLERGRGYAEDALEGTV